MHRPACRCDQLPAPARAEPFPRQGRVGRKESPVEIDLRIETRECRGACEIGIGPIGGGEAAVPARFIFGLRPSDQCRIVALFLRIRDGSQPALGNDRDLLAFPAAAPGVAELDAPAGPGFEALEDRYRLVAGTAVAAEAGCRGLGADDRDAAHSAGEGQEAIAVFQQHDALARRLARQFPVCGHAVDAPGLLHSDIGLFEQAEFELGAQHPGDSAVNDQAVDIAALQRPGKKKGEMVHGGLKKEIQAVLERRFGGLFIIAGHPLQIVHPSHRAGIGDDQTAEAPCLPEIADEQIAVGGARPAIQAVVGDHQGAGAALVDAAPEGRKIDLLQQPPIVVDRITVAPSLAMVGDEMFEGGDNPGAFELAHKRGAHGRSQEGIFAVALLHPAPAHISGDVDHR